MDLTDEELSFVTVSVQFSGMENGAYVRSSYTGKPEADPAYGQYLPQKIKEQNGQSAWCDLYYRFSYHIADKKAITVEARDRSIRGMMEGITEFWNETSLETLLVMTEEDVAKALDKIAAENSNDKITISISEDQISFDCMNELGMKEEGYKTGFVDTDALRIREKASDSASVSGLLPKKQKVFILSEEKGFYHVFVPGDAGLDGWVRKEYVDVQ